MAEFPVDKAVNDALEWRINMNLDALYGPIGPFDVDVNGVVTSFTVPVGGVFLTRLNVTGNTVIAARALTRSEFEAEFNPAP